MAGSSSNRPTSPAPTFCDCRSAATNGPRQTRSSSTSAIASNRRRAERLRWALVWCPEITCTYAGAYPGLWTAKAEQQGGCLLLGVHRPLEAGERQSRPGQFLTLVTGCSSAFRRVIHRPDTSARFQDFNQSGKPRLPCSLRPYAKRPRRSAEFAAALDLPGAELLAAAQGPLPGSHPAYRR